MTNLLRKKLNKKKSFAKKNQQENAIMGFETEGSFFTNDEIL